MQYCLITDQHFGAKADSTTFLSFQEQFYQNIFFPELEKRNINQIVCLGDLFDRRKFIDFNTLNECQRFFFDELKKRKISMIILSGNHDVYYKNTNKVNSIELLLKHYPNIRLINESESIYLDDVEILCVPWINSSNYDETMLKMKNTKAKIVFGHFEISGFEMYKNAGVCQDGLNADVFSQFDMVLSGHFHQPSKKLNIHYLGAPYEYTWADYDCDRGFYIYTPKESNLEYIKNPYHYFYKIVIDDEFDDTQDFNYVLDRNIKLIIKLSTDDNLEKYVQIISNHNPLTLDIIDNRGYNDDGVELKTDIQLNESLENEDAVNIIDDYISQCEIDTSINPEVIKTMFNQIFQESQQ